MKKIAILALIVVTFFASACAQTPMTAEQIACRDKASRLVETVSALAEDAHAAEKVGVTFKDGNAFVALDGPAYVGVLSFQSSPTIVVNNGPCDIYDTDMDGEYDDGMDCVVGWDSEVIQESYEWGLDAALERIGTAKSNRPRAANWHSLVGVHNSGFFYPNKTI